MTLGVTVTDSCGGETDCDPNGTGDCVEVLSATTDSQVRGAC